MRWGSSRRRESEQARGVVQEAERILEGRTVEAFIARRQRVPAWSLIGLLAHATRSDMVRLASPLAGPDPAGWSGTMARLARDLLALAGDQAELLTLQRRCLIPLELRLLGGRTSPPTTPSDLFLMVNSSLETPLFPEF